MLMFAENTFEGGDLIMRFYTKQHRYYCGIDLNARSMYVCILDPQGEIVLHRNMPCAPELFLKAVAPSEKTWRLAWNASSPGTGSPICAPSRIFLLFWGTRCT